MLACLILAALAAAVALRADPDPPGDGAVMLTGAAVLLAGADYPWYSLLLVTQSP